MISRIRLLSLPALSALVILCGCEAFDQSGKKDLYQKRQLELMREQENRLGEFAAKVNSFQDSQAELSRRLDQVSQQMSALEQKNSEMARDIATLRQSILDERKERQGAMDSMIKQVGTEMSKAMNSAGSGRSSPSGPVGKGKFVEYKVQSGATLIAIAQAYGVSVDEIRKANKMKNDTLRAGQILYIPQK